MEILSNQAKKPDKNGWILPTILGAVFLIWFFSTRDRRTLEEKMTDNFEESAGRTRLDEKMAQSRQDVHKDVIKDIAKELSTHNVRYKNVEISENRVVWVYISDNSKDGDYLANKLCGRAKKHFMQGVTLFDSQGNTIGRSVCK